MFLPFLALVLLPTAADITVAPDQPLPYVYTDDPLIIEFQAETDTTINAQLFLRADRLGINTKIELGQLDLHGNASYWHAIPDAPNERGFYTARIVMTEDDGETTESQQSFARIDRPAAQQRLPIYAGCNEEGLLCALPAVRSVGIDTIQYNLLDADFGEMAEKAAAFDAALIALVTDEPGRLLPEGPDDFEQTNCDRITRFDIAGQIGEGNGAAVPDISRMTGCSSDTSLVVSNAHAFEQLFHADPLMSVRQTTLLAPQWPQPSEIVTIKNIAAHYGQENWQVHVACPDWRPASANEAVTFVHKFLLYRAAGASSVGIDAHAVAANGDVHPLMSYLNGLALRFESQTYVGSLPAEDDRYALVFRHGSHWLAALWSNGGPGTVAVPVDGAVSLELTDVFGNTLLLPSTENGVLELSVGNDPLYLTGIGGVTLGRAALSRVTGLCEAILEQPEFREHLPNGMLDLIEGIKEEPRGAGSRLRFLELLRVLPQIEELWHTRRLQREVAVPALINITELIRALCLVEEDRGERFLEPLPDTLARAEELQSLYLTGSAGTAQARERGDWILSEVRRLIEEAKSLDEAGLKIEACAVGAFAEWRAHCLAHAAHAEAAPEPMTELHTFVLPEPEDEPSTEDTEADDEKEPVEPEPEPEDDDEAEDADEQEPDEALEYVELTHTVSSGESPYSIARKHGVSLDNLLEWNNLRRNAILRIGQELIIRVDP